MIDRNIQGIRVEPNFRTGLKDTDKYFTMESQLHNPKERQKKCGWLRIPHVPSYLTIQELEFMLGDDLMEMRFLQPHHFIACFKSSDAAKRSAFAINSRFSVLEMSAELLDEKEVANLLLKGDCNWP